MPRVIGTGLHVQDLGRAVDFYAEILGMKETARYELEGLTEVVMSFAFESQPVTLMLIQPKGEAGPDPLVDALNKIMLAVDDVRAICGRLDEWGCEIERPPTVLEEHGVTMAIVHDPDGHRLELLQLRSGPSNPHDRIE